MAPRADALRNRALIVAAATEAFSAGDGQTSMDAIARRAGVGAGTLYRHFPTREDLIEEIYRGQMDRLRTAARELLTTHAPARALRLWMEHFADWAAAKRDMQEALAALLASGRVTPSRMRALLVEVVAGFLDAGRRVGDLRGDIAAEDLAALLAGALTTARRDDGQAQLRRLLDLVVAGCLPAASDVGDEMHAVLGHSVDDALADDHG